MSVCSSIDFLSFFLVPHNFQVCAINLWGITLVDDVKKVPVAHWDLVDVEGWSSSPGKLIVRVALKKKTKTGKSKATLRMMTATTWEPKEACDVLLRYATEMMRSFKAGNN